MQKKLLLKDTWQFLISKIYLVVLENIFLTNYAKNFTGVKPHPLG